MRRVIPTLIAFVSLLVVGCAAVAPGKPESGAAPTDAQPVFICKAEIGDFRVSSSGDETFRLQLPRDPAKIEGSERIEGSSVCAYSIWTFLGSSTKYVISELGCYPDDNQPPTGAKGKLEIGENGASPTSHWCY